MYKYSIIMYKPPITKTFETSYHFKLLSFKPPYKQI